MISRPTIPALHRPQRLPLWLDSFNPSSPLGIPRAEEVRPNLDAPACRNREDEPRNVTAEPGPALATRLDLGAGSGPAGAAADDDFFHASNLPTNASDGEPVTRIVTGKSYVTGAKSPPPKTVVVEKKRGKR